jgi:hypothetical protein
MARLPAASRAPTKNQFNDFFIKLFLLRAIFSPGNQPNKLFNPWKLFNINWLKHYESGTH